VYNVGQMVKL